MEMAHISDVYGLAHERMIASVQREQGNDKYQALSEYGPYHAQYWSILEDRLEAGVPAPMNGGYQSPYSSVTPNIYLSAGTDDGTSYGGMNQQNGYDHPDGSAYTLKRNAEHAACIPPEAANVYPSPVDNFSWNHFPLPVDTSQQNLITLDNLASQILNMLLSNSIDSVVSMVSYPDMADGQAFSNMESMFERATRQYSQDDSNHFIDIHQAQLNSADLLSALCKANLAIFAISIVRGRDVPFANLNGAFLDIFMPTGTCLGKNEASLFLELKTQAFMAMSLGHNYPRQLVDELFPRNLQLTILRRRAEPQLLAPSEQDFFSRYNARRQFLLGCSNDMQALSELPQKYSWNDFLGELRTCIGQSLEYMERTKVSSTNSPIILFETSHALDVLGGIGEHLK
jgi:hypothetical protein